MSNNKTPPVENTMGTPAEIRFLYLLDPSGQLLSPARKNGMIIALRQIIDERIVDYLKSGRNCGD